MKTNTVTTAARPTGAELLEGIKKRQGVELQRLSRAEGALAALRDDAFVKGTTEANLAYDAHLAHMATLRGKLDALDREKAAALTMIEDEKRRAEADAKEKAWANALALGEQLKPQAARIDAALIEAAAAMNEARETVRQLTIQAPEKRMWVEPGELVARVENALMFACVNRFGGKFRSMTSLSELTLSRMTVVSGVTEGSDAYLYRQKS